MRLNIERSSGPCYHRLHRIQTIPMTTSPSVASKTTAANHTGPSFFLTGGSHTTQVPTGSVGFVGDGGRIGEVGAGGGARRRDGGGTFAGEDDISPKILLYLTRIRFVGIIKMVLQTVQNTNKIPHPTFPT